MKRLFITAIVPILAIGCASSPRSPENSEDKVISRIDNIDERPEWLKESEPFKISAGKVVSLGSTVIPANHRLSAAYRIAANNAKAQVSTAIEQRLEFVFQNAEEGTEMDTTQARYIGAEASKLTTSKLHIKDRYWEKVATTTDAGERITQYRVFVTVEMPEQDFKKAVFRAINGGQTSRGISSNFSEKVDKHWDSFVEAN